MPFCSELELTRGKDMDNYRGLKIRCDPGFGHLHYECYRPHIILPVAGNTFDVQSVGELCRPRLFA